MLRLPRARRPCQSTAAQPCFAPGLAFVMRAGRCHYRGVNLRAVFALLAAVCLLGVTSCSTSEKATPASGSPGAVTPPSTGTASVPGSPAGVSGGTAANAPAGTTAGPEPTGTARVEPTASTGAIPSGQLPKVRFTAPDGRTATLPVEVPKIAEYAIGLSGRYSLEGRGMVFYYPGSQGNSGFWMKNTHIDLDIAFVDGNLRVMDVLQMKADTLDIHRPAGGPYMVAIEAPLGWYGARGIGAGARAEFQFDLSSIR